MMPAWHQLQQTTLRITRPDTGAVLTVNTTSGGQAAAGAVSAVEEATIAWSRPHSIGHHNASHSTISLVTSTANLDAIRWDSRVDLSITYAGTTTLILAGWITDVARTQLADTDLWRVDITIEDVFARVAALNISDSPWIMQPANTRLARIAQLNGGLNTPAPYPADPAVVVAARDVDRLRALDIIQRCAAPDRITNPTTDGRKVDLVTIAGTAISWPRMDPGGGGFVIPGSARSSGPAPITLAAGQVEDPGRALDRSARVNRVAWNHPKSRVKPDGITIEWYDGTDTWTGPDQARAASEIAWSNDVTWLDRVEQFAARILVENATPVEQLAGPVRLLDLTAAQLTALAALHTRSLITIVIAGAPTDVDAIQRVISGELTIAGGRFAYQVQLQPARLSGLRPARIRDAPTGEPGRIKHMGQLRIRDMALTSY